MKTAKRVLALVAITYLFMLIPIVHALIDNPVPGAAAEEVVILFLLGPLFIPWGATWGIVGILNHFNSHIYSYIGNYHMINARIVPPVYIAFVVMIAAYLIVKNDIWRRCLLAAYTLLCALSVYGYHYYACKM